MRRHTLGHGSFPSTTADLQPGHHLCYLYESEEEHRAFFTPFLQQGIERNEKVIYITYAHPRDLILDYLRDGEVDVETCLKQGQLRFLTPEETYLRGGKFNPEKMIDLLRAEMETAVKAGYTALRGTGEMSWALGGTAGLKKLVDYELKLNEFFPNSKCVGVCQYDRRRFAPEFLRKTLRMHPIAVIGAEICRNLYYVPPAEFKGSRRPAAKLQDWLDSLLELKHAEESRQSADALFTCLVTNSHDGIFVVDDNYRFTYVNEELCRILGRTREYLLGRDFRDFLAEQSKKLVADRYARRQRGENVPARYEFDIVRKDGKIRRVHISSSVIRRGAGNVQTVGQILDITERTQREERLAESERKYRTLFHDSLEAMSVTKNGKIVDVNPAWLQLHGFESVKEVVGMDVIHILHPDDRKVLAERRKLPPHKRERVCQLRDMHKNGDVIHVELYSSSIVLAGEKAILTTVRDITARKRLELHLRLAERMESIGTLASGIAHNFNNILGVIFGNLELLSMDLGDLPEAREHLDAISQAAERATHLSEQLLFVARRRPDDRTKVNVTSLVNRIMQTLRVMLDANMEINWCVGEDVPRVMANEIEIEQVLMNICLNARDAMPKGGKMTTQVDRVDLSPEFCSTHEGMEPGAYVCLSITDNGAGMDEATVERIFDPFFSTKKPGKGTGLGLTTAYGTIARHGGCIDVESEPGKGSTFRIYLPATGGVAEGKPFGERNTTLQPGTETILMVDDEENILSTGRQCLEELGYTVLTANNGQKALEIFEREKECIDLALLDYMMPKMGGEDAFFALKKIDPNIKAVVATGYDRERIKRLLDAGVSGWIHKPYRLSDLSRTLREVLDEKKPGHPIAPLSQ